MRKALLCAALIGLLCGCRSLGWGYNPCIFCKAQDPNTTDPHCFDYITPPVP